MVTTVLSFLLLGASVYIYRKTNHNIVNKLCYPVIILFSIILYAAYFVSDHFTGQGIDDSVIYHVRYGLHGAGFSEYWKLITITIISLVLSFSFVLIITLRRTFKRNPVNYSCIAYSLFILSLFFNPAVSDIYELLSPKPNISNFDDHYKQPFIKQVGESKNLVVIYAESLERTYFDETIFPGLIQELRRLESQSTYFSNIKQVPRTHFTISGMVASQCGIPLFSSSHGNSMSGMDKYLPSATALGDLLRQEGYYLAYYGGADLNFAGKGKFLSTHGFNEIPGYLNNAVLCRELEQLDLKSGKDNIGDNLIRCYEKLISLGFVGQGELPLLNLWLEDLAKL